MKRRTLSLFLALALMISAVPVAQATQTLPAETAAAETVPATEAPTEETIPETTVPMETIPAETAVLETEPALYAAVASGSCGSSATWELSATGVLTVSGSGRISGGWKDYAEDIKTVTIKSGITGIGERAFEDCTNMTKITIPSTVTSLGPYAFDNCKSLTGITLPSGLEDLGYCTFQNCESLTSIKIPEGITEIGIYTFYYCTNLKTVTLPSTIEAIKSSAFAHCYALTGITLYQGLKTLGDGAFMCCDALKSVTLPNTLTAIPTDAFRQCENLTRVTIPSSVTSIGENAFTYTALTEVSIPASVTYISEEAFGECPNIKKFTVNTSNPSYCSDSYGVLYTKDKSILMHAPAKLSGSYYIPGTVTTIAHGAFENCAGMTSVSIPKTVTTIKSSAFNSCSGLTAITFPEGITEMADYVLGGCTKLKAFTIPQSVTSIGTSAFHSCESLTELVIPEGVTTIKDYAFMDCKALESIELPEELSKIPNLAFTECSSLKTITIPASVTRIGYMALRKCTSLESVTFLGDAPTFTSDVFEKVTTTAYYPADNATWTEDKLQNYGGTITWVPYSEEHVHKFDETTHQCTCGVYGGSCGQNASWLLEDGTLTISGTGAMADYSRAEAPWYDLTVKKLVVKEGITILGKYAFYLLKDLTDVTMADSVTEIGTSAFSNCDALKTIRLSASLKSIGDSAFMHGIGLTTITLPESLTKIGQMAFWSCENLAAIAIPNAVTDLGNHTFTGCFALAEVTLPEGLTKLNAGVFAHCTALKSITLPQTLTKIGESAFSSAGLTEVTIPAGVTSLGNDVFNEGHSLAHITFEGNAPSFGSNVFKYITTEARYPMDNATWTDSVKQNYGGTITWVAYCPGHEFAEATCTTPKTCTRCGETQGEALGHTEVIDKAVAATCTETGLTEGKHCSVCETILVKQEEIPVLAHSWNSGVITVHPTEETEGLKVFTCTTCGETREETVPALEHVHEYASVTTAPTCTEEGCTTHTCRCGNSYVDTKIPALGHSEVIDEAIAATCTETGLTEGTHCSVCETVLVTQEVVPAKGHSWNEGVITVQPTEETEGLKVFTCTACGETREETIPTLDHVHNYDSVVTAPTCTEEGCTTHTCRCGDSYVDSNVPALGHDYVNGTCTVCQERDPSVPEYPTVKRIFGTGRCQTAISAAYELKRIQGVEKFQTILVADGDNYPDALSGSYLAAAADAPILLVQKAQRNTMDLALEFIWENLDLSSGTVYILGGENSVSRAFETDVSNIANCRRLAGNGRYDTSLTIIQAAYDYLAAQGRPLPERILVCTGTGFADSLSASATGLPILLVNGAGAKVNEDQKAFLNGKDIYVIGGPNTVSEAIRLELNQLDADGEATRVSGSGRESTSVAVAEAFFPGALTSIAMASAANFPDGLSGGPLAYAKGIPLLLFRSGWEAAARDYGAGKLTSGYILGGRNSVSDASVKVIYGEDCRIEVQ